MHDHGDAFGRQARDGRSNFIVDHATGALEEGQTDTDRGVAIGC
jgi:hypothetical protein